MDRCVGDTFITRINLAHGCLIKKVNYEIHADILKLLLVVKKARRTRRWISEIRDDIEYKFSQDEEDDEIFLNLMQSKVSKDAILKGNASPEPLSMGEKDKISKLTQDDTVMNTGYQKKRMMLQLKPSYLNNNKF